MLYKVNEIGIVVGYKCNFSCSHCVTSKYKPYRLTLKEIQLLISEINKHNLRSILFVGGEPTLYIRDINKIISKLNNLERKKIKITTNGHFAIDINSTKKILKSFLYLNAVQLSYDKFHSKFLPFQNVRILYNVCNELGIDFSVILTIDSPLDVYIAKKLSKIGKFEIGIQKVLPLGKAKKNKISYLYPTFDKNVLKKFCPSLGKIKYLCGQGFSICCSALVYNASVEGTVHPTIEEHLNSHFYKMISSFRLSEIAKKLKVSLNELSPQHSSECLLCEYIFKNNKIIN